MEIRDFFRELTEVDHRAVDLLSPVVVDSCWSPSKVND